MIVYGTLVVRRYELLQKMLASVEQGTIKPDQFIVVDNGANPERVEAAVGEAGISEKTTILHQPRNIGVSSGFNLIMDRTKHEDKIIISNDDIELDETYLEYALHAPGDLVLAPGFLLFTINKHTWERVGPFDENLFPSYFEDNDYHYRATLIGVTVNSTPTVSNLQHVGSASLRCLPMAQQHKFSARFRELAEYYKTKWGGYPSQETFTAPFNGSPPEGWMERPVTQGGVIYDEPWLR